MLTFNYKVFLNISRFYNAALTQKGHYRISFSLDETCLAKLDRVTHYGEGRGGQIEKGTYYSRWIYVSCGRDSFTSLGSCIFHISVPVSTPLLIPTDHSVQIFILTDLICSSGDNLPKGDKAFNTLNQRQIAITLTPGQSNNNFLTVTSGLIHIAAVGIQIHASLIGMSTDISSSSLASKHTVLPIPSFNYLLFNTSALNHSRITGTVKSEQAHARQVFRVLEEILQCTYADLRNTLISYSTFTRIQLPDLPENLVLDDDLAVILQSPVQLASLARNISEIISELSSTLNKFWKKYLANLYGNESVIKHLAIIYHGEKVQYMRQSVRSSTTNSTFCTENVYLDDEKQIKNTQQQNYYLHLRPRVFCVETMGPLQDRIFIEEIIYTPTQEAVSQNQIHRVNGYVESVHTSANKSQSQNNKHRQLSRSPVEITARNPDYLITTPQQQISTTTSNTCGEDRGDVMAPHTSLFPVLSHNTFTPSHKPSQERAEDQLFCNCLPFKRRGNNKKNKIPRLKGSGKCYSQEEFYPSSLNQESTPSHSTPLSSVSATGFNSSRSYLDSVHANPNRRSHPNIKLCYSPTPNLRNNITDTHSDPGAKLRSPLEESTRSSQNCTDLDEVMAAFETSHNFSQLPAEEDTEAASVSHLVVTLELDAQTQPIAGSGFHVGNPNFLEECKLKGIIDQNEVMPSGGTAYSSALEKSIKLHSDVICSSPQPAAPCSLELSQSSGHCQTASYNSFRHRELTTVPVSSLHQFRDLTSPYLPPPLFYEYSKDFHLVICVHGLDGNFYDLRLFKTYLTLALPKENLDFLMSGINQGKTYSSIEDMADNLINEIFVYLSISGPPKYLSFIGHSMGNLIIRRILDREEMRPLLHKLSVFVSLCGPHLGSLVYTSGLVQAGMWVLQKWHQSISILQLQLKDGDSPRQSFLYKLSSSRGIQHFKSVVLVGSPQDKYTPYFSSLLHPCPNYEQVPLYREMLENFLAVLKHQNLQLMRYKVHYNIPASPGNFIGRTAHIAVLDCEQFVEKFVLTCLAPYFADLQLHQ